MAFKTVAFVGVRETAALLENVGGVNLEGVGLILQTIVRVASGIATEVFKDGFSGVTQREVVAHADVKVLEEAYTGTHVPSRVEVARAEVRAAAEVAPTHVVDGKAKLRTGGGINLCHTSETNAIDKIHRDFKGTIGLRLVVDVEIAFRILDGGVESKTNAAGETDFRTDIPTRTVGGGELFAIGVGAAAVEFEFRQVHTGINAPVETLSLALTGEENAEDKHEGKKK